MITSERRLGDGVSGAVEFACACPRAAVDTVIRDLDKQPSRNDFSLDPVWPTNDSRESGRAGETEKGAETDN